MKVIFFGTPQFSAHILSHLLKADVDVCAVVTMPDRPKGRSKKLQPTPVKEVVCHEAKEIPLFQPEKASTLEFIKTLEGYNADLFIVVGYGEILSKALLEVPKIAAVNIHTSLLPAYRGAAPIQRAIMAGEKVMGISIMEMNPQMDAGGIIAQASFDVDPHLLFDDIENELNQLAKHLIVKVIRSYEREEVEVKSQDTALVSLAPKIETVDCFLDFRKSSNDLHNLVRALSPKPAAFCEMELDGKRLRMKVFKSRVCQCNSGLSPGHVVDFSKERLLIACGTGGLEVLELQVEGKGRVSIAQFYAGYHSKTFSFVLLK